MTITRTQTLADLGASASLASLPSCFPPVAKAQKSRKRQRSALIRRFLSRSPPSFRPSISRPPKAGRMASSRRPQAASP